MPEIAAEKPNGVWSVDLQFDSTATGKPLKFPSIVDEYARERFVGIVDYSTTGLDLTEQLDVLAIERGMPKALRMDTGQSLSVKPWLSGLVKPSGCSFRQGNPGKTGSLSHSTRNWDTNV